MAARLCYGSRGRGAQVAFHYQQGAYDTDTLIGALEGLRRFLGGQKATLVWDGLPAHRSKVMRAWLGRQRSWLVVEPLPAYAHELNPVEPLWASLKGVELANLAGDTLGEVIAAAERGIQRIRHTHHLPFSFLRYCGLSYGENRSLEPANFFLERGPRGPTIAVDMPQPSLGLPISSPPRAH
jgi:DDE superfamily endonuclease